MTPYVRSTRLIYTSALHRSSIMANSLVKRRKLGPVQSPVVSFTLAKKKKQIMAGKAMKNVVGILLTVVVISVDW